MAIQREIIFSARDNGVESTISRIKESATDLGKSLIREALDNTSSAKEALRYYEDQIRLIERRNRIESQQAKLQAQQRRDAGIASTSDPVDRKRIQDQFKQTVQGIDTGSKEDQLQVELLRELIDTIRSSAREENRQEDKRSNTDRIHAERIAIAEGDEINSLKNRIRSEQKYQPQGGAVGGINPNVADVSAVLGSDTAGGAAGGSLAVLGRVAAPLAIAFGVFKGAQALWGVREDQELQLRELAALTGTSVDRLMSGDVGGTARGGFGPVDLNVSREEFRTQVAPQVARSLGTTRGLLGPQGTAMQSLEIQKALGVSPDVLRGLERSMRSMMVQGGANSQDLVDAIIQRMSFGGAQAFGPARTDMSRMQDILSSFVQLQQSAFMRHGNRIDPGMILDLMGRFETLGGVYKDDQYKASTIQALDRGLSSTGTPEVQAIRMGLLRQLNPEMGFFDLQAEMQKGIESQGYLGSVLQYVRNTGGDSNAQKILFSQLTGGQMRFSDIQRIIESGALDDDGLGMGLFSQSPFERTNFRQRALAASSQLASESMWMNEWWEDTKGEIFDFFKEQFQRLVGAVEDLADLF